MRRNTAGERARRALQGHWAEALAWEGASLCAAAALAVAQGVAGVLLGVRLAFPPDIIAWMRNPTLLCLPAVGLALDILCLSPIRFGRTSFYAGRATAFLPFALPNTPFPKQTVSLFRGRHGRAATSGVWALLRRLLRGGRYRRLVRMRLLWWGWNAFGAVMAAFPAAAAWWMSASLPDAAAPYPLLLAVTAWPLAAAGLFFWLIWEIRLSPMPTLLAVHPDWGVLTAARAALCATRGQVGWILRHIVGFVGWFLACFAVIPLAYVQPLYAAARAEWLLTAAEKQK